MTVRHHGVAIRCSTRADGDFHPTAHPPVERERVRRGFVDLPWTMVAQLHGTKVVRVTEPGGSDGDIGDVAITSAHDSVLGCWAADCAPLVLIGDTREFAIVHAGWRGLAAGVIDTAVAAFREPVVAAALGPAIGPCCYEFGIDDLADVAAGVHAEPEAITSVASDGAIALDVPAAVAAACRRHGIEPIAVGGCTGCDHDGFSHRVRAESQRHVVAAWRPSGAGP